MIPVITPPSIAVWPLAARLANIALIPNVWHVLVVSPGSEEDRAAEGLVDELSALIEGKVSHRRVKSVDTLVDATQVDGDAVLVIDGLAVFDDDAWRALDINRSRLERSAPTILVVSPEVVAKIPSLAPNLWSWVGDSVWTLEPEEGLPPNARELRLIELRRHFGFDDGELVRRAREETLPLEPDLAEWLVLLGRGSLIKGRS